MVEWTERIPMMILPENANDVYTIASVGEFERCPCGSSVFRIVAETVKNTEQEMEYNWWQVCAVCGGPQGGWTQHIDLKEGGREHLLRIDRTGKKVYYKE